MNIQATVALSFRLSLFVIAALIIGAALCLPLFRWRLHRLLASSLWIKIIWWIPLYVIFTGIVLIGQPAACVVVGAVLWLAFREARRFGFTRSRIAVTYVGLFGVTSFALIAPFTVMPELAAVGFLIAVTLMSVLSDVTAFFLGNYGPFHHALPAFLNPNKSWEGVAGQLIGAMVGGIILALFIGLTPPIWLVLLTGASSAFGDLFNSAAKRSLDIKEWGQTIPGHGGVLDRLSSLNCALSVSLLAIILIGVF